MILRDWSANQCELGQATTTIRAADRARRDDACGARPSRSIAITGTVSKVSNLILGFTIHVRDDSTGRLTRVLQAGFRGNTDESWLRGIRWLVANRLLAPPQEPR
jgi:hypothetical protein